MTPDALIDTNILVYAALGGDAPAKRDAARAIILEQDYATSAQVLAEFYNIATSKGQPPLSADEAARWVETLSRKPCQPIDADLVQAAIAKSRRHDISYADAAVLAAAERLGCKTVYSDTLAHGETYGSVRVVNPFLEDTTSKEG
jgi:predicted nucleic acid-binding protein